MALRHLFEQGQLSFMMKSHNHSRSFSHFIPSFQKSLGDFSEIDDSSGESDMYDDHNIPRGQKRKVTDSSVKLIGCCSGPDIV